MLGGSAVHFALAASFFTEVRVVGPVGDDFGAEQLGVLESRGVITDDIERVAGGETFFWRGHYEYDMNVAHTDDTQLNVFAEFDPKLSDESRQAEILFLGNIQPELQRSVRELCEGAKFAALDSMNFWLDNEREALVRAIGAVDCLLLNDAEIRELTGEPNLARAARAAMEMGPGVVVAKRGEYGAALFSRGRLLRDPGLPARGRQGPHRGGRQLRGRVPRLPRQPPRGRRVGPRPRRPAPGDGLRLGARLVQRRGLRHRAGAVADPRADRRTRLRELRQITLFEVESGTVQLGTRIRSQGAPHPGRGRAGCAGRGPA